jgi:ABC-type lipoprotein export system ATPase subunit
MSRWVPMKAPAGEVNASHDVLRAVVQSEGVTALVATHDPNLIEIADSVLELEDGKIKGH